MDLSTWISFSNLRGEQSRQNINKGEMHQQHQRRIPRVMIVVYIVGGATPFRSRWARSLRLVELILDREQLSRIR